MDNVLLDLLQSYSLQRVRPDKTPYTALLFTDSRQIAKKTGRSLLAIECAALKADILPERYSRNQKSLTNQDQLQLLRSHVVIVGLGGLGGTVVEILARIGIGRLTVVDGDCFDESNLNRQLLSSLTNLGKLKAEVARKRISEINPAVEVCMIPQFFSNENGQAILDNAQVAIDCLDSITDRLILENICQKTKIPLVSAAVGGSSGQATVIYPNGPGLKHIYGSPTKIPTKGVEIFRGTLPFTAMYMATVECAAAVSILLGKPSSLQNRLFFAELSDHSTELFSLANQDGMPVKGD